MTLLPGQKAVFRFAPSPNGALHLGHAYSACLNDDLAQKAGGRLLLRMEDTDLARCRPEFEQSILDDLSFLGIAWELPVRRQSEHITFYADALEQLKARDLVYPAFMTRGEIRACVEDAESHGAKWPRDPDGSPHYPPFDRERSHRERSERMEAVLKHSWRLNMGKALAVLHQPLRFSETGPIMLGEQLADPALWGDVILWRSDAPSSYHLSVTLDDALQGVTHVVRGMDMFASTSIHRLLQALLDLPTPVYHHHRLFLGPDGRKLSKSLKDQSLSELRQSGHSASAIRELAGFGRR